eukprot:2688-Heterococcus_DN1.PRE.3
MENYKLSPQFSGHDVKAWLCNNLDEGLRELGEFWDTRVTGRDLINTYTSCTANDLHTWATVAEHATVGCTGVPAFLRRARLETALKLNGYRTRELAPVSVSGGTLFNGIDGTAGYAPGISGGLAAVAAAASASAPKAKRDRAKSKAKIEEDRQNKAAWEAVANDPIAKKQLAERNQHELVAKYTTEGYTLRVTIPKGVKQAHVSFFEQDPVRVCNELGVEYKGLSINAKGKQEWNVFFPGQQCALLFEAHAVHEGKVGYTPITAITQLITYQKFLGSMVSSLYRQDKKSTPIPSDDKIVRSHTVSELQHKCQTEALAAQHRADYEIRQLTAAKASSHDQNAIMQLNSRIEDRKTACQLQQTEIRNRYNQLIEKRQQSDNIRLLSSATLSDSSRNQRKQQQQHSQQQQQQQSNKHRLSSDDAAAGSSSSSSSDIRMDTPLTSSMLYNMDGNTLNLTQSVIQASSAAVGPSMYDYRQQQQQQQQQQLQQQHDELLQQQQHQQHELKRRRVNSPDDNDTDDTST